MRGRNDDLRKAVLKRPRLDAAPTLRKRQKKSQPDKGWDFTLWWRTVDCLSRKFLSQIAMESNAAEPRG